jgi:LAO/AO transport system kinase
MKNYKPKGRLTAKEYIDGILSGDRVILSRGITIVESNLESDKILAKEIIQSILPFSGNSKGSILGDKTRMEELANLENAYIRPSATGDTLGGVANKTGETMLLCEAAGYDVILIETVGVGQSETAVHGMTDFFLLLMLSGAGDELQGIKKGIMEMADMVVINKADGDNIKKSEIARRQYQNALHIFPQSDSGWSPVVTTASAIKNIGIDTVWDEIEKYKKLVDENGYFDKNRIQQQIQWMYNNINEELKQLFYGSKNIAEHLSVLEKDIISSKISPVKAAQKIIEEFKRSFKNPAPN